MLYSPETHFVCVLLAAGALLCKSHTLSNAVDTWHMQSLTGCQTSLAKMAYVILESTAVDTLHLQGLIRFVSLAHVVQESKSCRANASGRLAGC